MTNLRINFNKLSQQGGYLTREDLTPNQKKHLWKVMQRHEAKPGFSYERFFAKGFRKWELIGIDAIKNDFLKEHQAELAEVNIRKKDTFYHAIGRAHLKLTFVARMAKLGMGTNTVVSRFGNMRETDFKEFERIGISTIIEEFINEVEQYNID